MAHTLTQRIHEDEAVVKTFLEGALLRYGVLLGSVLVLAGVGFAVLYFRR